MTKKKSLFPKVQWKRVFSPLGTLVTLSLVGGAAGTLLYLKSAQVSELEQRTATLSQDLEQEKTQSAALQQELEALKSEDQVQKNRTLQTEINNLKNAYRKAVAMYNALLDFQEKTSKTEPQESLFASLLTYLSRDDLANAEKTATALNTSITQEEAKLAAAAAPAIPANVPEAAAPPSNGYRRQKVTVNGTSFLVDIVAADLNSTRVIVDTASDSTCTNDCPVLSLADYVGRSGAYAGINGTYFCPSSYPDCADKKNSFDVLVMNKNKVYFNSDNNVFSTVPVVVFTGSSIRVIPASQDWGRDTGVDAVIANRPLIVYDGNSMFSGGGEAKEGAKGNRSFVGGQDNMAYIGVVHGATVAESALVVQSLGIRNAINLDNGGSTALWAGGYKVGPGRALPNVVLFVQK